MKIEGEIYGAVSDDTFFKNLLDANNAAPLIKLSPQRLTELAESGFAPCIRIDGGAPLFHKKDLLCWARSKITILQSGKPISAPRIYYAEHAQPSRVVPKPLIPISERLVEYCHLAFPPCVYFLIQDNEVVYVGQSVYLPGRLSEHICNKEFDRVFYLPVPRSELGIVEGGFIKALKPKLNGTMNNGTSPDLRQIRHLKKYDFSCEGNGQLT